MPSKRRPSPEARFIETVIRTRAHKGWTQAELAEALTRNGLPKANRPLVAKIESGDRALRLDEAVALSAALGLDLSSVSSPPLEVQIEAVGRDLFHAINDYDPSFARARYLFDSLTSDDLDEALASKVTQANELMIEMGEHVSRLHYLTQCVYAVVSDRPLPRDPATISDEERERLEREFAAYMDVARDLAEKGKDDA